jgi:hypothetical protein
VSQLRVEVIDELGGIASTSLLPDPNGLVNVEVFEAGASASGFNPPTVVVEVASDGPQGPPGVVVSDTQPAFAGTGLWVQTGLGPTGDDFTFWIEDGT